jgi:hypothetical protein
MKILLQVAIMFCGLSAAVDSAFAQTWIQQTNAPNTNWVSVASSADGTILIANVGVFATPSTIQGPIYKSTDSGITWVQQSNAPNLNWQSVASSANGSNFIVAAGSQSSSFAFHTGIYTSTNSGLSWISNNLPVVSWFGVASSADGSKLIAAASGKIYTSTNFGANWSSNNIPFYLFYSCASSADGSKLIVGSDSGPINISTNSGKPRLDFVGDCHGHARAQFHKPELWINAFAVQQQRFLSAHVAIGIIFLCSKFSNEPYNSKVSQGTSCAASWSRTCVAPM